MKFQNQLTAHRSGGSRTSRTALKYLSVPCAWMFALLLTLACRPAFAAHTITQGPNFAVDVNDADNVTIDSFGGFVRVVVTNGASTSTTTGPTLAGNVVTLTVTATGSFANTINLGGINGGQFSSLTTVTVNGGAGADIITGTNISTGDTLNGEGAGDTISGANGGDTINGGPGSDILSGDAGNDTYVFDADGAQGSDSISESSGNGTDTLDFAATTTDNLTVDLGIIGVVQVVNANLSLTLSAQQIENVTGGTGNDTITGNNAINVLRGGDGNDTLTSRGAADTLIGQAGTDEAIIVGTSGDDNFSVLGNAPNVSVDELNSLGIFDVRASETLTINGQGGADTFSVGDLTGVTNTGTINLNGLAGDDIFNIAPNAVAVINVAGGAHTVGDTLNFDLTGVTSPQLSQSGANGTLTSSNRQTVNYTGIEFITPSPEADSLIVTTTSEDTSDFDNVTSLLEAILFANTNAGDDTITFDLPGAGPHTIQLTQILPAVSSTITFDGPTNESVTIRGGGIGAFSILMVDGGQTATINNLTFSNADTAVFNNGTLTVTSSTLSGNGNGVINNGTATLVNATVSGNSTGVLNNGTLNLTNVTITGNTTGVDNSNGVNADNTIIAGNTTNVGGAGILNNNGDNVLSGDPELGPLQNNGGPTFTHALLYGSPALDGGSTALTTDQRGLTRPVGSADDIGAFEVQALYSISGYIRINNVTPVAGVSVQLSSTSGATGSPVLTDANGFYSFAGVPAGNYLVTPTKTDFTFAPASAFLSVTNAPRAANFIATRTAPSYRIIGRISTSSGQAVVGVTVTLTPAPDGIPASTTTNSAGYYTFNNVPASNYTITPSGPYTFTPANRNVTVTNTDIIGQNFIATTGYSVYGRIATSGGIAIPGVDVQLDGGVTVQTNSAGYYTFNNVANGSHTVVPSKAGYTFAPTQRAVEVNNVNVGAQNFTGTGP